MNATQASMLPDTTGLLNDCSRAIIKILLYYDIFQYPLREDEIRNYLSIPTQDALTPELAYLHQNHFINYYQGFYFIGNNPEFVNRRIRGNSLAEEYLAVVVKHVHWLSVLPFIQCICISGSLSKKYMDKKSDVDYFIITDTDRLWIFRAILTIICKFLWLFRSGKYLCPNYIISKNALEIKDRNIYTAIEIATLLPVYNAASYLDFMHANQWIKNYFPNFYMQAYIDPLPSRNKQEKQWANTVFNRLDKDLFWMYKKHYEKKFDHSTRFQSIREDLNFNKEMYKMHISGHRPRILEKYEKNLLHYEKQYCVRLTD